MKILFTAEHYYPEVGEISLVVKNIAEGLFKNDHDLTIVTTKVAGQDFESLNGINIT